jgi:hypothetical protein
MDGIPSREHAELFNESLFVLYTGQLQREMFQFTYLRSFRNLQRTHVFHHEHRSSLLLIVMFNGKHVSCFIKYGPC